MKPKCIIFGAGYIFGTYVSVIENKYEIIAVADNNTRLHGQYKNNYKIISPNDIFRCDYETVIICSKYAKDIQLQLVDMGIANILLFVPPGLLCDYGIKNTSKEVRFYEKPFHSNDDNIHILFAQIFPCSRTNRFARIVSDNGMKCSLAYFGVLGKEMQISTSIYDQIIPFFSYNDFIEYVKNSEYDLIHCSNEPDILTCLLLNSGKPIVHDCHDFLTLRDDLTAENIALELVANSNSCGCIYPSERCMQIAIDRYSVDENNAIYLENYPSINTLPPKKMKKLSMMDNEIHCVYEGAITDNPDSYRFFEEQWLSLAACGVHVHFYTQFQETYCRYLDSLSKYIHYEGNLEIHKLLYALTQYDVGLCTFIEHPKHKIKLDTACPNKLYEYLAAGLPVALSNHRTHCDFLHKHHVGGIINWNADIMKQIYDISRIFIPDNFILYNKYTMEDNSEKLISFYKKTIKDFNER